MAGASPAFAYMNCLITQTGERIDCYAGIHKETCKRELHISMGTFLKRGGIRVKICYPDTETIAIEYYHKLTELQIRAIRKILRQDDYYAIILESELITKFRPIRSFDFSGVLPRNRNING